MLHFPLDDEIAGAVAGDLIKLKKVATVGDGYRAFRWWLNEHDAQLVEELSEALYEGFKGESEETRALLEKILKEKAIEYRRKTNPT